MNRAKVPLVSAYQIILSSQAHSLFNFELISTNLISISKLKFFVSDELSSPALPIFLTELSCHKLVAYFLGHSGYPMPTRCWPW